MALELVSGADFCCKLMSRASPCDLGGSRWSAFGLQHYKTGPKMYSQPRRPILRPDEEAHGLSGTFAPKISPGDQLYGQMGKLMPKANYLLALALGADCLVVLHYLADVPLHVAKHAAVCVLPPLLEKTLSKLILCSLGPPPPNNSPPSPHYPSN